MSKSKDKILSRKYYLKPEIMVVRLDNTISLVMMTAPPNPPPRGVGSKGNSTDDSFASPFEKKPFG